MSKQTKATLKGYFVTGAIPTQNQFADLIESMAPAMEGTAGLGLKSKKDSEGFVKDYELDIAAVVINVSAINGQTYTNPADAAAALIALNEGRPSVVEGMGIKYKDPQGRIWEYKYANSTWVLNGDRSYAAINEELNDEYINSSGELTVSTVISGSGEEGDPFIYKHGTSPFVEIAELEGIYYKGKLDNGMVGVCAYDANMVRLASGYAIVSATANNQVKEVYIKAADIPAGTKYVRFCSEKAYDYSFRIETDSAAERNSMQIIELRKDVRNLKLMQTGGVAGFWDTNSLNPQMESFLGNKNILDDWDFYLIKEDGDNTKVIGKLQKNNLFRFEDGSFAPVMIRTAEDESENPGWETLDQGYAIVRAWNHPMFILDGVGLDGRTVHGLFQEQVTIDGITAKMLEQTGICADLPTMYNSTLRCIMFKNGINTGCGSKGKSNLISAFEQGAYPKTNVSQITNNTNARKKNTNQASVSIFSEQMGIHKLSHIFAHFLKYGTYDLHNYNMFGGGISANDSISASNWGKVSGVRWSLDNKTTWNYAKFDGTPTGLYVTATQTAPGNWSECLNNYYAKLQTLEAQAALSYVVENNISEDVNFEFNGGHYFYKTINGTKSPLEGEMNAKLFKMVNFQQTMYDSNGDEVTVDIEVMLQVAVVDGYISWGDVFDYGWAGMEAVCHHLTANECRTDAYLCTLQHNLYLGSDVQKTSKFDFQSTYEHTGQSDIFAPGSFYTTQTVPYSLIGKKSGAGLHTGSCAYNYRTNYYGGVAGNYSRLAMRGRGAAHFTYCSSRAWYGYSLASLSSQGTASAYQVRLTGLLSDSE